jgi:hypothetical protein
MRNHALYRVSAAAVVLVGLAQAAHANVYGFQGITLNDAGNVAIGASQLRLDVTSPNASQVLFTFHDIGPGTSDIKQVFFEKGVLSSLVSISSSAGVSFSQDLPKPGNLPGGNSLSPKFAEAFSASAASPAPTNGVNNTLNDSETVVLLFNLAAGKTFSDVLTDLGDSGMRVGVHVIAYGNGGSESFINGPDIISMPDAATGLLMLAGAGGLPLLRRRLHG